jgi:hypothetical protein
MYGSCVNDHFRFIADVVRALRAGDHISLLYKLFRQRGPSGIGSGDSETFLNKNGSKPAHADPAYTDEVDIDGVLEIYTVHM